jgi:hypothetical protein
VLTGLEIVQRYPNSIAAVIAGSALRNQRGGASLSRPDGFLPGRSWFPRAVLDKVTILPTSDVV